MKRPGDLPNHRDELGTWLNRHGLVGEGAEIGCAFGGFAQIIVGLWKGKSLYMVDPWAKQDDYRESTNETAPFDEWYAGCVAFANSTLHTTPRVRIVRKRSTDGAKEFQDGCLDFVFIDGNHRYDAVMDDLRAWWPKVKAGGLVSGHDFGNQTMEQVHGWDCEVQRAVETFIVERGLPYPKLTPCSSFWMIKP